MRREALYVSSDRRCRGDGGGIQPLVVHFGTHKTGSTSIQETLHANISRLDKVDFMAFGLANASLTIRNAFMQPERLARRLPPDAARNPNLRRRRARERFKSALAALKPERRAILSAELISHLDADECADLVETLRAAGKPLIFVGYMRDPVSYYRSWFQQRLKKHGTTLAPEGNAALTLGYNRIINELDALIGAENVWVYPFDRAIFPQGDVVRHFLHIQGIDADEITLHHSNESLPLLAVKALYCYRRHGDRNEHALGDPASRKPFIAKLAALDSPAFRLHPDLEARIASANESVLDWSEHRLGQRLAPPSRREGKDGVRDDSDLMHFTPVEMEQLERWAGPDAPVQRAETSDPVHVAALLAAKRRAMLPADRRAALVSGPP